ncbi:hypothetical protein CHS0354_029794 [Potamilus streckersoni]|uniref:Uncharacterized protein n=1 Tax=Potamilus streckersoni TaxID=2493646 RepID=A0AAE0TH80_9BIVA|nr:hypothetical protein CHS0354_029794 [Potamilus streckersoni]
MVLLRFLVVELALLGLHVWPAMTAQECTDAVPDDVLLEADFFPANAVTYYPERILTDLLSRQPAVIQESIRSSQNETEATIRENFILNEYYYDVCPSYSFVLPRKWWFFFFDNNAIKCFSLQPIYLSSCKTHYCSWNSIYKYYWWYQCVPEWRYQYFWAVCVDQNGTWSIRYLKRRLPACCNCKRYYRYSVDRCKVTENVLN